MKRLLSITLVAAAALWATVHLTGCVAANGASKGGRGAAKAEAKAPIVRVLPILIFAGVLMLSLRVGDIFNLRVGPQPVLRETNAAFPQIRPDLLMLGSIESVLFEQFVQRGRSRLIGPTPRQQNIEKVLHHAPQLRLSARRRAELVQLGPAHRRQFPAIRAQQGRHGERIVARGH